METDTLSLRKAAPQWSLAGDKQLLGMLEKIHQTIVSKCQDANAQLEAMVDALDNASVDLQNVNNKFMALSNSQFVESRVYDDDVDVAVENIQKQEPPKVPTADNNAEKIKLALQKLEMMHEAVHILDSDSSDDEQETRMVLKPKDVYSHRPLPYIIGSFAWKSKWHAGVLPESDSDSDSCASRADADQYSASEPEPDLPQQNTISSSSSLLSEEPVPVVQQKPADIAAEISRRLVGPPAKILTPPPEAAVREQPTPAAGKVYRMDLPTAATIFPDEPPPIDNVESDYSDDDIFAELHKKPHQNKPSQYKADIMDDLFGNNLSNDVGNVEGHMKSNNSVREQSPISDNVLESKPVAEVPTQKLTPDIDSNLKKPVGGISLFGTNKEAESIGAAILKRNQRISSSSDEEADVTDNKDVAKAQGDKPKEAITDSKKIIEDLFAKPVKKNEKDVKSRKPVGKQVINKEPAPVQSVKTTDKIDLFSDNLFDDIDDIFTTNVISKPKVDKNTKSIFDDDDDLFSDVTEKPEKTTKKDTKSIFDSDDDLFNENNKVSSKTNSKFVKATTSSDKTSEQVNIKVKSIFDDDSDDDLFSDIKVTKNVDTKPLSNKIQSNVHNEPIKRNDKEIETRKEIRLESDTDILNVNIPETKQFQSPSLFDDEDDELFNTTKQIDQNINIPKSSSNVFDSHDSNRTVNEESAEEQSSNNLESKEASSVFVDRETSDKLESEQQNLEKEINKEDITDNDSNKQDKEVVQVKKAHDHNVQIPEKIEEKVEYNDIFSENILKDEPDLDTLTSLSNTQKETQEPILSETKEPDLFADIFTDLPPAFEKPSEPKKSKNVNALFDDDSDDESLFFKKDDVISDDKPEVKFDSDRFTIFHDEPPDIDVDFSQKPLKTSNDTLKNDIFNEVHVKDDDKPIEYILPHDLDDTIVKSDSNTEPVHGSKTKKEITKENIDILKLLEAEMTNSDSDKLKQNNFQDDLKIDREETHSNEDNLDSSGEYETKKQIGKLKPMNFNINVNTLLPGASPKKSKANEETDGQSISSKSNEELNIHSPSKESKTESSDPKMVKSVSFDGDPDSEILDNKLSKERAKIQVKRRPSSRRARLEAVRKSRIDLGSDSTDNSGSFDEPLPRKNNMDEADSSLEKDKSIKRSEENIVSKHTEFTSLDNTIPKISKNVDYKTEVKSKVVYILNDEDIFSNPASKEVNDKPNKKVLNIVDDDDDDLFKPTKSSSQTEKSRNVVDDTKEQLNPDKSLFYNSTDKEVINDKPNKKILNIIDDDDDLFKATDNNSQKNKSLTGIETNNTLGLKDTEKVPIKDETQHKKSLFDDSDDDEELFKNKTTDKVKKSKIFDSESEDELFGNKRKIEKKEIPKGPLFDDESDDDLFGTKTVRVSDTKSQPSKRKETKSKSTEPVFEDPLSMLGDDS